MYIRYLQIKELHTRFKFSSRVSNLNKISVWVGLLSALGVSIVGNFQETNVIIVHLIGAIMAFGLGCVYCILHTSISYKTSPIACPRFVCHIRLVCSAMLPILFFTTFLFAFLSLKEAKKGKLIMSI